jgi:hypothetical protein
MEKSKKKNLVIGLMCILAIVVIICVFALPIRHQITKTREQNQMKETAVSFLADFFAWDGERGNELATGEKEEYEAHWGDYLTATAIDNLMNNREPVKYDFLYGKNSVAEVKNIECVTESASCNFTLQVLCKDENDVEKTMDVSGQLQFSKDTSAVMIDNVYYILEQSDTEL